MTTEGRSAFFYDPDNPIFKSHNLKTYPAILHNHQRHRVKHADYPAIRPQQGSTVRGTYVTGLTDSDIWRLDIFEGPEYRRESVKPRLLTKVGDEAGAGNVEGEEVQAETYIWSADLADELEDREWDFFEFQREKMRFWVGSEGAKEYAEVDEAVAAEEHDGTGGRGTSGHITSALNEEQRKDETLKKGS